MRKILKYYGRVVNFGFHLGIVPYKWENNRLTLTNSPIRRWFYRGYLTLVFSFEICFLVPRCYQTLFVLDVNLYTRIAVIYFTFGYLSYNVNELLVATNFSMYEKLMNSLVEVGEKYFEEVPRATVRLEKSYKGLMKLWSILCAFIVITHVRNVVGQPELPSVVSSVFPNPKRIPRGKRLLIALYHLVIVGTHFYMVVFTGSAVILFAFININITMNMKYNSKSRTPGEDELIFRKYHTELSVFQKHFKAVFGIWPVGSIITSSFGVCINTFLGVTQLASPIRSLMVAGMGCFGTLKTYRNLGKLYDQSSETLASWKIPAKSKEFRKHLRACQPLRVTVGSFFYADRTLVLTIFNQILDTSASMIITFRS